jgi:preprotein translocase subunit SecE
MVQFQFVKNVFSYFKEVRLELSKVVWPDRADVIKLTVIVFIFSAIVALYVGGLDVLFTKLLESVLTN